MRTEAALEGGREPGAGQEEDALGPLSSAVSSLLRTSKQVSVTGKGLWSLGPLYPTCRMLCRGLAGAVSSANTALRDSSQPQEC